MRLVSYYSHPGKFDSHFAYRMEMSNLPRIEFPSMDAMKLLAFALIAAAIGAWVIKSLLDRAVELKKERMHYQFPEDDERWWEL